MRSLVPQDSSELSGVLRAYSDSVDNVFYMLVGCGVLVFGFSLGMGLKDIRKNKPVPKKEGNSEEAETV